MFRRAGVFAAGAAFSFGASSAFARDVARESTSHLWQEQVGFSPKEFRSFPLVSKKRVSPDTEVFTFRLPSINHVMGMTVASCIVTRFKGEDGKDVIRPYTPISKVGTKGTFDILVKKYPGGKMGTHIHELRVGETLDVKGPFVKMEIVQDQFKHIGMVAGGTGITPMLQVIHHVLDNPEDKTKVTLVYANKTEDDILLKSELDNLARIHPRFSVYYTLDSAPKTWKGGIGFINSSVLESYLPRPGEGKVMVCGPPGFMKHISGDKDYSAKPPAQGPVDGILKSQGYQADDVFKF